MPNTLRMIPGFPTIHPVLYDLINYPIHYKEEKFIIEFSELLSNIKKIVCMKKGIPIVVPGTSQLMVEMLLANLVNIKEDVCLVLGKGNTSINIKRVLNHYCEAVDSLTNLNVKELEMKLDEKPYKVVIVPHVDQETGIVADLVSIGKRVRDKGAFFIVDGTASLGAHEIQMDAWKVDAVFGNSSWGLGAFQGLGVMSIGVRIIEEAQRIRKTLGRETAGVYYDLIFWSGIMEQFLVIEKLRTELETSPELVRILSASLKQISLKHKEYIEAHKRTSRIIREILNALGLSVYSPQSEIDDKNENEEKTENNTNNSKAKEELKYGNTFTVVELPETVKPADFLRLAKKRGLVFGENYGELHDKTIRIGHTGFFPVDKLINFAALMEKTLDDCKIKFNKNTGINKAIEMIYT